ncbi:MAG: hypothetical protein V3T83_17270 [Acidobacteriota bacterium]
MANIESGGELVRIPTRWLRAVYTSQSLAPDTRLWHFFVERIYGDGQWRPGRSCQASFAEIEQAVGMHRSTLVRGINRLKKGGVLTQLKGKGPSTPSTWSFPEPGMGAAHAE